MQTKIYELVRRRSAYFETKYCGVTIAMPFVNGCGSGGVERAEFITNDKFTQDAVESDPRFNREYYLARVIGEPEDSATEKQRKAELEKKAATKSEGKKGKGGKKDARHTVSAKADGNEVETEAEESGADAPETGAVAVESVKNVNDAYDYFAEMGIVVETEDELKEAMKEKGVTFPNLK